MSDAPDAAIVRLQWYVQVIILFCSTRNISIIAVNLPIDTYRYNRVFMFDILVVYLRLCLGNIVSFEARLLNAFDVYLISVSVYSSIIAVGKSDVRVVSPPPPAARCI